MMKIITGFLKLALFGLLIAAGMTLLTANTPILGVIRSYVVQTGSMEPNLPVGSLIYVIPQANYAVGQVITFERGKISVTHRIVEIKNGAYLTKGDANKAEDLQVVAFNQIKGRVELAIPEVGLLINFLKTVPGFLLLMVLPTFVFVIFEAWGMKKEWEKELEKKFMKRMEEARG